MKWHWLSSQAKPRLWRKRLLAITVLITLLGTLITRLLILKFKIKSPLFG
ncbi:MAG: hypothetical protein AB8E74_00170 [Prochlorococcus sp.]|jgi:hypothetical protein